MAAERCFSAGFDLRNFAAYNPAYIGTRFLLICLCKSTSLSYTDGVGGISIGDALGWLNVRVRLLLFHKLIWLYRLLRLLSCNTGLIVAFCSYVSS